MIAYAVAWLVFGLVHSLSSREPAKAVLRQLAGRTMRLWWNGLAVAELAAVLAVGHVATISSPLDRPFWLMALQGALAAAGVVVLAMAARSYDMRRFLGLRQLGGDTDDEEPFRADGLLSYVRHPLYLGTLLILTGLVRDTTSLQCVRGFVGSGCARRTSPFPRTEPRALPEGDGVAGGERGANTGDGVDGDLVAANLDSAARQAIAAGAQGVQHVRRAASRVQAAGAVLTAGQRSRGRGRGNGSSRGGTRCSIPGGRGSSGCWHSALRRCGPIGLAASGPRP